MLREHLDVVGELKTGGTPALHRTAAGRVPAPATPARSRCTCERPTGRAPGARIALIHATRLSMAPIDAAFARALARGAVLPPARGIADGGPACSRRAGAASLEERFVALSRYAAHGRRHGILYTCSAFGAEIDAARRAVPLPTLKPNEAMLDEALAIGARIGLVATFEPSLASMADELRAAAAARGIAVEIDAAVRARRDGRARARRRRRARRAIADAVGQLHGLDVVLLAQFSMARARAAVDRRRRRAGAHEPGVGGRCACDARCRPHGHCLFGHRSSRLTFAQERHHETARPARRRHRSRDRRRRAHGAARRRPPLRPRPRVRLRRRRLREPGEARHDAAPGAARESEDLRRRHPRHAVARRLPAAREGRPQRLAPAFASGSTCTPTCARRARARSSNRT